MFPPTGGRVTVLGEFGGAQFSGFKASLVDLAVDKLSPIASEMKRLSADHAYVDSVLASGSDRARAIAAFLLAVAAAVAANAWDAAFSAASWA